MLKLTTKGIVVAALMWGLAIPALAQPAPSVSAAIDQIESTTGQHFQGVPTDWSSHHLVVSAPNPASPNYNAVQQNPRYWMQVIKRTQARATAYDPAFFEASRKKKKKIKKHVKLSKDWQMFTGGSFITPPSIVIDMFPAKFTFTTNSQSCSDFVIYSTEQIPTATIASIVAFNNLYAGTGAQACGSAIGGTVPTTAWAYNTSAISPIPLTTSPVLSLDGTQVAFVQGAKLILLKPLIGSGTLTAPVAPTVVTNAAYRACAAPCMTSFTLDHPDTRSSPFVDYAGDVLWVGDNGNGGTEQSELYKFTGVFKGTPTEAPAPFPVVIGGATDKTGGLTGPVFDSTSGLVFVGDIIGGFLYSVDATTAVEVKSAQLSFNGFLNDAPIVDSTTEKVYYFSSDDAAGTANAAVFQFPATFTAGAAGLEVHVGAGFTGGNSTQPGTMFSGAFDEAYFNSGGLLGNLFTVGNQGGTGNGATPGFLILYQIPIVANLMVVPIVGPTLTIAQKIFAGPITEFDNGEDQIFLSVTDQGTKTAGWNCNGKGCIVAFDVDGLVLPLTTLTTPVSSTNQGGAGGTTAVVVDNNVTSANNGGAQVYWLPLDNLNCQGNFGGVGGPSHGQATGVCAIQASQANLTD